MVGSGSVNRAVLTAHPSLPLYPDKRTISEPVGMSQTCQQRSGAVGPVSVPFMVHRQSGCGPDRHKASLAPSCLARRVIWVSAAV